MDFSPSASATLREIGAVQVTPNATAALKHMGVPPACVGIDHAAGRWGGIYGIRGALWSHNASMDAAGVGGWISLHEVGRAAALWIVTSVAERSSDRKTYVYMQGEPSPLLSGEG